VLLLLLNKFIVRSLLIAILFFAFQILVYSQNITITGYVKAENTAEPIQFTNVLLKNEHTGTSTDETGKFSIESAIPFDTLIITYIGYKTDTIYLKKEKDQQYTINLIPENFDLNEVVIKPKEEPAKLLMRKVIENKKQNDQQNIAGYKSKGYTKIELDIGNLTAGTANSVKENAFNVLRDHIDTISDDTPFLPFFLTETVSDFYYRKSPKSKKEVIQASRTSGINNASISQVLGNYYEQFNIYDNYWYLLSKNFIPPVCDAWNFFYKVALVDSAYIDDDWCYRINFYPKQKQENVFEGYMWIADGSFAVKEVLMNLDSTANINYYKRGVFYQKYDNVNDSLWVMVNDKLVVEFAPGKTTATIIARKTSTYSDYIVNPDIFIEVSHYKDDIVYSDSVIINDESYWADKRPMVLTENELGVYELVDSLQNIKAFTTLIEIYNTLMYGYWNLGYVRIGPFANMASSNEVEGLRLRLGVKTGDLISKRMALGGYLAYGFKDKTYKYGSEFNLVISKKPWQQFKFNYENDLDIGSSGAVTFGEDNLLSGIYRRRETPQKLIDQEKFTWFYQKDWIWGLSNSIILTTVDMHPLFDIYYYNGHDSLVSDIQNSEINFGFRFAYREKFLFDNYRRYSIGTKYPVLTFNYKMGVDGLFKGDFNYRTFEFTIKDYFTMGSIGGTTVSLKSGKIFGTLPTLLLESPPGNETYFMNHGTFNLMNEYEFVNDTYAELFITHSFWGFFLNKVPLVNRLKLREVASFKMAYGSLSHANQATNNYLKETEPFFIGNASPTKPYMEAGIGLENIFKLIRVDAIWRLTYRNNPLAPNFGVRVGVSLDI